MNKLKCTWQLITASLMSVVPEVLKHLCVHILLPIIAWTASSLSFARKSVGGT